MAILSWGPNIKVISIDGSAPDPAGQGRARLAHGRHAIYYFGTVSGSSACGRPRTGDDLAQVDLARGAGYVITARAGQKCEMLLEMREYGRQGRRVAGPDPELWPAERLARVREVGAERVRAELQRVARAASAGDPEAGADLGLWYLLGDEPLSAPDPVAAEAWLLFAADRGSLRADALRARLEPTLSAEERRAAARLAADPPIPETDTAGAQP